MQKILALFLVTLMIFALVGCGGKKREIVEVTLSTEDSEAILAAAGITLPDAEAVAAAGSTVQWFSWSDWLHNYDEDEIVNTGFWTFKEKYGCEIEWIECVYNTRFDELATLVLGGNAPDSYPGVDAAGFPYYCLKGVFADVNPYINFDDPLWADVKPFVDNYFSMGGERFLIATEVGYENVCIYNRRVMEEHGFDDPAELYYNDEWTWDVFTDMCIDFSNPDEEKYALDGWGFSSGLMHSSGATVAYLNPEAGIIEHNLDDPRLERAADMTANLMKNECIWPRWNHGWGLRGEEGTGMKEGLTLFWIRGTWVFTGTVESISNLWGDVSQGEVMFCPMPRDPNGNGLYYTESKPNGYYIVKGCDNPEGVALLASCERFKILDPTVIDIDEKQLKEIYLWTDEMMDMYRHIYDLAEAQETIVIYGEGLGSKLSGVVDTIEGQAFQSAEPTTWAQIKESYTEQLDYYADELNKMLEEAE